MAGTSISGTPDDERPRKFHPMSGRKILNYRRPLDHWIFHPALREGQFRLYDVPAMMQDAAVSIGLLAIYGPIRKATFEVRANGKDIKTFIENTIYRFWHHDLMKVLPHYIPYGTSPCEVLYEHDRKDSGYWKYAGMDDFSMLDVQAVRQGRHIKKVRVSGGSSILGVDPVMHGNNNRDVNEWNVLEHPKIFWCAHQPICGNPFGNSAMRASWGPWMEKCGSHGAVSNRRLWAFANSFRGCLVKYPPGVTQREDGTTVDNQQIAREMAEVYCTGAALFCPSGTDENGQPLWEIIDPKLNGEIKGLMEYPNQLDRDIWMGMGVLDEVIHAPDVGGSWSGRSGPLKIFLDIEDMRVQEIMTSFDVGPSGYTTRNDQAGGIIQPLVQENFGDNAKYEIRCISLIPKPAEPGAGGSPGSAPGGPPPGAPPWPPTPAPGPMGAPPAGVKLSAVEMVEVELADDAVKAILESVQLIPPELNVRSPNTDTSLSASLFDANAHPRGDAGRFTHKPIKAEHVLSAQKAMKAGKLGIKHSEEPVISAASGVCIHHHVTLESGQHVHQDELHRLHVEDGEVMLHPDEGLDIHEPSGKSTAKSFSEALHNVGAFSHKPHDPVTIVSKHGYSATRPRSEWADLSDGDEDRSFSEWYDAEGHEHTGRHVESDGGATLADEDDTERFFHPASAGQGRLAFSASGEPEEMTAEQAEQIAAQQVRELIAGAHNQLQNNVSLSSWDEAKVKRGQPENAGEFATKPTTQEQTDAQASKARNDATHVENQHRQAKGIKQEELTAILKDSQATAAKAEEVAKNFFLEQPLREKLKHPMQWCAAKAEQQKDENIRKYGVKGALAIWGAGQVITWGITVGCPMAGIPVAIPPGGGLATTAVLAALVDGYRRLTAKKEVSLSASNGQPLFSGILTDSLGRERYYVNGKPVARQKDLAAHQESGGTIAHVKHDQPHTDDSADAHAQTLGADGQPLQTGTAATAQSTAPAAPTVDEKVVTQHVESLKRLRGESFDALDSKKIGGAMQTLAQLPAGELAAVATNFLAAENRAGQTDPESAKYWAKEVKRSSRPKIIKAVQTKIEATYKSKQANRLSSAAQDDDLVLAELLDDVSLSAARAPHGYTQEHPLAVQGHNYVGGQFIPHDVMAKATPEERAKVHGQAPAQTAGERQHEQAHAQEAKERANPPGGKLLHTPSKPEQSAENQEYIRPANSLGIPREQMPQISSKHVHEFMDTLKKEGIPVKEGSTRVGDLKPTQDQISVQGMNDLRNLAPEKLRSQVIVSSDGYILDGHHRWGELNRQDPNSTIQTRQVGLPIRELLQKAKQFPGTTYKSKTNEPMPRCQDLPVVQEVEKRFPPANPNGMDTMERHQNKDGSYTPQRAALHARIGAELRGHVPPSQDKTYMMLGGGPASGKTSIIKAGLAKLPQHHVMLDSDAIKAQLPEFQSLKAANDLRGAPYVHEESSDLAKRLQKDSFAAGQDVVLDGTGDSSLEAIEKKSKAARAAGYKVAAEYCTCSVEEAVRRNIERAKKEGRLPPEDMLRAVHKNISSILPEAVKRGLFDGVRLWDTEHKTPDGKPSLVMSAQGTEMKVHHPELWQSFLDKAHGETKASLSGAGMEPLTMKEKARILRDVSLGVPAPDHESEAARHWRLLMERQVEEGRENGHASDIPWDPEAD